MDRDAASALSLPSPIDAVPPVAAGTVRTTGFVGIGIIAVAALLGAAASAVGDPPAALNTARLLLVLVGSITAGAAISMRPELWWTWAMGAGAALLGVGGLPGHWDSFRLLFSVLVAVALVGTAFTLFSPGWRMAAISAIVVFHFSGIFTATTSPPTGAYSAPWVSVQAYSRVFSPYLQFIYQRNAYHFYSPEPGPASVLAFLLKTDTGETELVPDPITKELVERKKYETKWVVMPKRPDDVRDPLGLSYYRRLSLTEQLARGTPLILLPEQFEKTEMSYRRGLQAPRIPYHPTEPAGTQYKLASPDVSRYLLPSYASHVVLQNTKNKDEASRTTVKIYRLEHRTLAVEHFTTRGPDGKPQTVYHPGTYRPFFLGEYDARGTLVDPQEPLLYWMIPIIPRTPIPNDPKDPFRKEYLDYLSAHALEMSLEDVLKADESKGQVFNWSQLR